MGRTRDTGGPAFPCEEIRTPDGKGWVPGASGMTLLDWFAGQALAIFADNRVDPSADVLARAAYDAAEAMLAEKRRRREAAESTDG